MFIRGKKPEPLNTQLGTIGVTICNENFYPDLNRILAKKGAKMLVNISNDGWFSGPGTWREHFAFNIFRAVENRKDVAVSSNGGISGIVSPLGKSRTTDKLYISGKVKDNEIVCGVYVADHRSADRVEEYVGLDDDPAKYRIERVGRKLKVTDTSIDNPRKLRNHRRLVLEELQLLIDRLKDLDRPGTRVTIGLTFSKNLDHALLSWDDGTELPLDGRRKRPPKLLFLDVGLMNHRMGIQADFMQLRDLNDLYRGRIAEQVVGQNILAQYTDTVPDLYYWSRGKSAGSAEVDYCCVRKGTIVGAPLILPGSQVCCKRTPPSTSTQNVTGDVG